MLLSVEKKSGHIIHQRSKWYISYPKCWPVRNFYSYFKVFIRIF